MIYFIQAGDGGPVKIGYARSIAKIHQRLRGMQTSHHAELVLLGFVEGSVADERAFHRMFEPERIRGEWFQASDRLLETAHSRDMARWVLDLQFCRERWERWGLVDDAGLLTHNGESYLLELERRVMTDGWQLSDWYAENFGASKAAA